MASKQLMIVAVAVLALFAVGASAQGAAAIVPGSYSYAGSCYQLAGASYDGKIGFCTGGQLVSQNIYLRFDVGASGVNYAYATDASVTISIANTTTVFLKGTVVPPRAVTGVLGPTVGNSTCFTDGSSAFRGTFAVINGAQVYIEDAFYYTANGTALGDRCPEFGAPLTCNATIFSSRCVTTLYSGPRV